MNARNRLALAAVGSIGAVLGLVFLLGWGLGTLENWLAVQMWVTHTGGQWEPRAGPGWGFLWTWVPGLVIGLGVGALTAAIAVWAGLRRVVEKKAKQAVAKREQAAREWEDRAQRRIREAEAREAVAERRIEQGIAEAQREAQQARVERDQAKRTAEEERARARDAEQRRQNAAGAAERRRRKVERMKGQSNPTEGSS